MSRRHDSRGLTLVELLVVLALLGVVGAVMLSGVVSGLRATDQVEAEADALDEVRVAVERLSRDLRQARLVDPTSTAGTVVIWIDVDSDYRQAGRELLTWELEPRDAGGYDLVRRDGAGGRWVEPLRFATGLAFTYDPAPPDTREVSITLSYKVQPGPAAATRSVPIEIRLRNAP